MDHLAENLFGDPRKASPLAAEAEKSPKQLQILAAAGEQGEIVEIARRIKARLTEKEVRPQDVLVVFRTLRHSAGAGSRGV